MKQFILNITCTVAIVLLMSIPAVQASHIYQSTLKAISGTFTSGPVLIGTSAQLSSEALYVKAGDDGLAVSSSANINMIIEDSGNNYFSMRAPDANINAIYFSNGTAFIGGGIEYKGSTDVLSLYTNGGVKVEIEQDGDLLVKTTSGGLIMTSPDASQSRCTVDNSDNFTCTGL